MDQVPLDRAGSDLPDIGSPAEAALPRSDEYQIGLMIMKQLRDQGQVLEDPESSEYVQSLGARIASQAEDNGQPFHYFIVKDPAINAFALPGGFIGVNSGTILASTNESQLASVLAHETAHVAQRHIARTIRAQSRQGLAQAAAILAAILVGAAAGGSGDVMQGAIAVAQGTAIQQQINFTRANEYEADRVGISYLAAAGFDPQGMADIFEAFGLREGLSERRVPEFFQTHPVTSNRIAEARNRAAHFGQVHHTDSVSYALVRERLRVMTAPTDADERPYYAAHHDRVGGLSLGERYGEALALLHAGDATRAVPALDELVATHPGITMLHGSLGEAQMATGQTDAALATFARAMVLFPRNVPLAVRYADVLMRLDRAKQAHLLLLDVFNNEAPTPEQIRLTARAASAAGDAGDAYYYMSEYHIDNGELPAASQQLELALASPNLTTVQRERFRARLKEIRDVLAEQRQRNRGQGGATS
ncbi:MAG TPA: M48 family metalloprotease [Steroidobacteraceae bacterium]